jgi:hypothetical protein
MEATDHEAQTNFQSKAQQHAIHRVLVPKRSELIGFGTLVLSFGHSNGVMIDSYGQPKGTSAWPGRRNMHAEKSELLQGTLDLRVRKTLYALGPLHSFGIARRIGQVSRDVLELNEGTV